MTIKEQTKANTRSETFEKHNQYGGHAIAELRKAFEQVEDPEDWRGPISSLVEVADLDLVMTAISYFTGTEAVVEGFSDELRRVTSEGYRLGPCGP